MIVFKNSVEKFNIIKYFALGIIVGTHPLPISLQPNKENLGTTPFETGKNLIFVLFGHLYTLHEYLNINSLRELNKLIDGPLYLNLLISFLISLNK